MYNVSKTFELYGKSTTVSFRCNIRDNKDNTRIFPVLASKELRPLHSRKQRLCEWLDCSGFYRYSNYFEKRIRNFYFARAFISGRYCIPIARACFVEPTDTLSRDKSLERDKYSFMIPSLMFMSEEAVRKIIDEMDVLELEQLLSLEVDEVFLFFPIALEHKNALDFRCISMISSTNDLHDSVVRMGLEDSVLLLQDNYTKALEDLTPQFVRIESFYNKLYEEAIERKQIVELDCIPDRRNCRTIYIKGRKMIHVEYGPLDALPNVDPALDNNRRA